MLNPIIIPNFVLTGEPTTSVKQTKKSLASDYGVETKNAVRKNARVSTASNDNRGQLIDLYT